jgi:hypothetical protein
VCDGVADDVSDVLVGEFVDNLTPESFRTHELSSTQNP